MRYRWMTIPTLALGMMAFAVGDGLAQRGSPGGGRGMPSPDDIWAMYGGGPDGILDLSKNPKTAERMLQKGYAIPKDGIVRKEQFLAQVSQRMQSMQGGMGGPPGGMGGPPATVTGSGDKPAVILVPGEDPQAQRGPGGPPSGGPGGDRGSSDRGSRDRGGDRGSGGGGPPGWGGSGGGERGTRGGDETRKVEDPEDERPNVLRYGKTPKELPGWFTELDTDKDAQIGLYEWRTAGKSLEDFLAKDLNGDGFLTVDEVLKSPGSGTSEAKADRGGSNPFSKNGSPSAPPSDPRAGKNDKGNKSDKSETKPSKEEKKPESTGGNPFLKK